MTDSVVFHCPTRVIAGAGCLDRVADELAAEGIGQVVLVSDPDVSSTESYRRLERQLEQAGVLAARFVEVEPEPSVDTVARLRDLTQACGAPGLVALGGGSVIDAAKAAAVWLANPGRLEEYAGFGKFSNRPLLVAAIPTTAGTGSEVSDAAAITDTQRKVKFTIRHLALNRPRLAVLDPTVLATLPRGAAIASGLDALTHAVESYTSRQANPFTRALALQAIELIAEHMVAFVEDRTNLEAATGMQQAACLAALSFTIAGTGNAHCIARYVGGRYKIPHGMACAIALPYVTAFNQPVQPDLYERVRQALGPWGQQAKSAADAILALSWATGATLSFAAFGIPREGLEAVAEECHASWYFKFNPRDTSLDDFRAILEAAWEGRWPFEGVR